MNTFFTAIVLIVISLSVKAQSNLGKIIEAQPFGKIDKADLELSGCDFEKDANAEVLFDVGKMSNGVLERHIRIKVFNDFGKSEGNVRLDNVDPKYIEAETINFTDGKVETTPIDRKSIYTTKVNNFVTSVAFAMPNVKAGSVLEISYRGDLGSVWYFQSSLPTRYSEITTDFPGNRTFKFIPHVKQPYVKNRGESYDVVQVKALANIHSLPDEPFVGSRQANLQRIEYIGIVSFLSTWTSTGEILSKIFSKDDRIDANVTGSKVIISHAKGLKSIDDKIAYLFDTVKNRLNWNNETTFFVKNGSSRVWDTKIGNSAEINWLLYSFLIKAGVPAFPLIVGMPQNAKINPGIPDIKLLRNMVVFVRVDSTKHYVLDATDKYGLFNAIPINELNSYGLYLDEGNKDFETLFLQNEQPVLQSAFLDAVIKPDGKMTGDAELTSYGYHKIKAVTKYKTDGEEKYIKYLTNNDNNLKIASLNLQNIDVDSIPLTQKFSFTNTLSASDDNYIYFHPNLFMLLGDNPFKKAERYSDIDFGYRSSYAVNGVYKLPAGFKAEALPVSLTIIMPDESIIFKRTVVEDDGSILVKYVLSFKKSIYFKEDYPDIHDFYKKMYEMLDEQIVLKKS